MSRKFEKEDLKKLFKPGRNTQNGQITIIGGSRLFHGAPLLSLKVASRMVDMVFFSSPEETVGEVVSEIKSKLSSFIWVPWGEVESYIEKSDACLIGPGFMRYETEKDLRAQNGEGMDRIGEETKKITQELLTKYKKMRWVIDAGSLQTMEASFIPENSILTPNPKEYQSLFGKIKPKAASLKYKTTILLKGEADLVCADGECFQIKGGNPGMVKGGTGDVLAGLAVSFFAKNESFLSARAASFIAKRAAEELAQKMGLMFNADDLAEQIPQTYARLNL